MSKMVLTEQIKTSALDYIAESVGSKSKNCLGRLKGVCADFLNPTRNGRKYSRQLWEKVIGSDTFKEYLDTKTLFGELNHPADRLETDIKEIAISLADIQFSNDGTLIGTFDILDTPNGRILKSLCDYGSRLGVSSRGGGDVIYRDGENYVDELRRPDTLTLHATDAKRVAPTNSSTKPKLMEFVAFDIVGLPAVKSARPSVIEGVEHNSKAKTLKESVLAEIDSATNKGELLSVKRIIESVEMPEKDSILAILENKLGTLAGDGIPAKVLEDLNKSLKDNESLKKENATLKESISAGTTREMKLKEELEKVRSASQILGDKAKKTAVLERMLKARDEQPKVNPLTEQLNKAQAESKSLSVKNKALQSNVDTLLTEKASVESKYRSAVSECKELRTQIAQLNEAIDNRSKEFLQKADTYKAQMESTKADLTKKLTESNSKLIESEKRNTATLDEFKKLGEQYIAVQCKYNGLDENLIKGKLGTNYSINNINRTLNEALDYKCRIGSLPFVVSESKIKAQVVQENAPTTRKSINPDDDDLSGATRMLKNFQS